MKATGIVRRIDDLGRVVIPKEIRRTMRIREGDPLEIYTDNDGQVIFKKYSPIGELSAFAGQYAEVLSKTAGYPVIVCDRDHVISVAGVPKKELIERRVSPALEEMMEQRRSFAVTADGKKMQRSRESTAMRLPRRRLLRGRCLRKPDVPGRGQPGAGYRNGDQADPGRRVIPWPPNGGIAMAKKNDRADSALSPRDKLRVQRVIEHMIAIPPSRTDPNGSYTGRPMARGEVPVQDADDL